MTMTMTKKASPTTGTGALPNPIASAAAARPDHPALVTSDATLSWGELLDLVRRQAHALVLQGIAPGARIGLDIPPSVDWLVTFHALGWIGAIAAPLPPRLTSTERQAALDALGLDAVLLWRGLPSPEAAPTADSGPAERPWPLHETRVVLSTSGSTGAPRPVELTTAQLVFSAFGSTARLGHSPDDRWLCCLPLHHVGGLSIPLRCALLQTTVLLQERFEPDRVSDAIDAGDATLVSLVPTMLERLLDARRDRPFPGTLRAILVGGAATPEPLLARCRAIDAPLALTWGMTEAGSQVATRFVGDLAPISEAGAGPALPFNRVSAPDGTLVISGPTVGPEPLRTDDLGRLDADPKVRNVHLFGRRDHMIISGGENVAPREIEDTLLVHPEVGGAAVVGVPDDEWGERPWAWVLLRRGAKANAEALRAHCRQHLQSYKVPDRVIATRSLPLTSSGKIAYARLRQQGRALLREKRALARDQVEGAQGLEDALGDGAAGHRLEDDGRVDQPGLRPQLPLGPEEGVGEGHRAAPDALDLADDAQPLAHPHRAREVRVAVDQGHAEAGGEDVAQAVAGGDQQLLEDGVAVVEDTPEERDASSIDVLKAHRHRVLEGHEGSAARRSPNSTPRRERAEDT